MRHERDKEKHFNVQRIRIRVNEEFALIFLSIFSDFYQVIKHSWKFAEENSQTGLWIVLKKKKKHYSSFKTTITKHL